MHYRISFRITQKEYNHILSAEKNKHSRWWYRFYKKYGVYYNTIEFSNPYDHLLGTGIRIPVHQYPMVKLTP